MRQSLDRGLFMRSSTALRRGSLLAVVSTLGLVLAAPAAAEEIALTISAEESPDIIVRSDLSATLPPPGGTLDSGVTGVGQQIAFIQTTSPTSAGLSLCSGTLINPRTVITAAHCLNARPAHMYGSNTGTGGGTYGAFGVTQGVPLSFGFNATNRCQGVAVNGCAIGQGAYELWRDSVFQTQVSRNIYNANQVWYDPRSLAPNSSGFLQADVALVTLDTPAFDIPTWALLFSPLDGPTNSLQIGYGVNGTNASVQGPGCPSSCSPIGGIDYRRRSAENIISFLGSLDDRNNWLYGPGYVNNPANLYMLSFSDPSGVYDPATGKYDFGIFGGPTRGDVARTREGITAGGDSGGPLVVESKYGQQVVAAVLSGGSRFFTAQRFSTYGTNSFYQPLHAYWQTIVANNPYIYAGNIAGNRSWEDPAHWVQLMDPNYMIDVGGTLVNSLPNTPEEGVSGSGAKFGYVCFLDDCTQYNQAPATGTGGYLVVPGGPGSVNFVPNNVEPVNSANAALHVRARYYDVTLGAAGTTTLGSAVTIDKLTVDGPTKLSIAAAGDLKVWGDFNQIAGWTNIDGKLKTSEAMILSGLLSGSGTFDPTVLTVVGGVVAPGGGDKIGTLTILGDTILASASALFIDIQRGANDRLAVTGNLSLSSLPNHADGASIVFNKVTDGPAPRHNESFTIAQTTGGNVLGQFKTAYAFQGVLRPELTYDPTAVKVKFVAGKFVEIIDGGSATELAFASALDTLRAGYYNNLWDLYGSIDWMSADQLKLTFNAMTPRVIGDVEELHERQSKLLLTSVSDRLSLMASGKAEGLAMVGNVAAAMQAQTEGLQSGQLGFGASHGGGAAMAPLPGRMSGFIAGGVDRTASSYGGQNAYSSQGGWHMAMGLEMPLGANGKFGTAAGIAEGESSPNGDSNRSRTTMAAAYAAMPLGDGFYVGGVVAAEASRTSLERMSTDGNAMLRLSGATKATRYTAVAEAGFETGIGNGLTLTPRAQLGYGHYTLSGFTEAGGETALKLDDVQVTRIEARLGAKLAGKTSIAGVTVVPQLSADYVSLLSGAKTGARVRFAVAPDHAFDLPLTDGSTAWAEIKGGVTFGDGPFTLGLSGQHATGNAMTDNRAQADVRFRF
jgi:subtilase-type serine protease